MDGYAVRLSGKQDLSLVLPVAGRTSAGDPPGVLAPGTAHRIMTGAALPDGADTVVMQELVMRRSDLVQFGPHVGFGSHIRRTGEDVARGSVVLQSGRTIRWAEIALLSALGIETVPVAVPLRIAVITTGSELHAAGEPLPPGAIYDANGPLLSALLASPNSHVTSITIRDDVSAIMRTLEDLVGAADLLITTAGMSVGEGDHVRDAMLRVGGRFDVVGVAMKPGKPLAFGKLRNACFVGLPGNPQAVACGALAFVRPMMAALLGEPPARRITATMAFSCRCKLDRTELVPVRLCVEQGRLIAHRSGPEGSHRMMPMALADAVAVLPGASATIKAGSVVEVLTFDWPLFASHL
jgi:molybdopterin molybdotransferase